MKKLLVIMIFTVSSVTHAEEYKEIWACRDTYKTGDTILVEALVFDSEMLKDALALDEDLSLNDSKTFGVVRVANREHLSLFSVDGFNRRWNFGLAEDGSFNYAFVIKPTGTGLYYDFTMGKPDKENFNHRTVNASQVMTCEQTQ